MPKRLPKYVHHRARNTGKVTINGKTHYLPGDYDSEQSCAEFLKDASHLIMDRDASFIAMREFLEQNTDTEVVLLPPKSPNLNAYMERWFRSLKSECLSGMIFFGGQSLENAVGEYVKHYHGERNHQGLGNQLIAPEDDAGSVAGKIECRERLGGMLKYYHRRAA